jgi:hypothetical protein
MGVQVDDGVQETGVEVDEEEIGVEVDNGVQETGVEIDDGV